MLSNKQSSFLKYLVTEASRGREFPTFQEMVDDGASPGRSNAHNLLSRLVELGMVQRIEGAHRRPYRVTARGVAYCQNPQGVGSVGEKQMLDEARRDGVRVMAEELKSCFLNWPNEDRVKIRRFIDRAEERADERFAANA